MSVIGRCLRNRVKAGKTREIPGIRSNGRAGRINARTGSGWVGRPAQVDFGGTAPMFPGNRKTANPGGYVGARAVPQESD